MAWAAERDQMLADCLDTFGKQVTVTFTNPTESTFSASAGTRTELPVSAAVAAVAYDTDDGVRVYGVRFDDLSSVGEPSHLWRIREGAGGQPEREVSRVERLADREWVVFHTRHPRK